jgi:hypothetical protein
MRQKVYGSAVLRSFLADFVLSEGTVSPAFCENIKRKYILQI